MIRFIARQRLRFNEGLQLLNLLNYFLLMIAASDKLGKLVGVSSEYIIILAPLGLVCVWAIGWWLVDGLKITRHYENEAAARSPIWEEVFGRLERIERKLDK